MTQATENQTASFGFRDVAVHEKAKLVRGVFDSVAAKYDIMNDLMSGGLHRLWKDSLIDSVRPKPGDRIVDVAGGTGDIAFRLLQAMRDQGNVTVIDINEQMLRVGRDRAINKGLTRGLDWVTGNAECLPVEDGFADAYTIAFGIRNVTHIDRAIADAYRVLKPGGRFFVLEFSPDVAPGLDRIYDTYSFDLLPKIGQLVANDAASYRYLAESIRKFPKPKVFAEMIEGAGFKRVSYRTMSGGIVALHQGVKV